MPRRYQRIFLRKSKFLRKNNLGIPSSFRRISTYSPHPLLVTAILKQFFASFTIYLLADLLVERLAAIEEHLAGGEPLLRGRS